VGAIEAHAGVGLTGVVEAASGLGEHHPLVHVDLAGVHAVWALFQLQLRDEDGVALLEVPGAENSLTLVS
jgi:hypothetical protein